MISALSWALLHSLWIGAIATVMAWVVLLLTRANAAVRYKLLATNFVLFILSIGYIFFRQLYAQNSISIHDPAAFTINASWLRDATDWYRNYSAIIVYAWLIAIGLRAGMIFRDMRMVNRLRACDVQEVSPYWNAVIERLSLKIGVRRSVQLKESVLVRQPAAIGFMKPVILVPPGLLTRMPLQEVDAILLHELAHVKRNDYVVNLVQSFAVAIFFFNPFAWWMSVQLKEAREHCCDDVAINATGDKAGFVRALVTFSESYVHQYAMGFGVRAACCAE